MPKNIEYRKQIKRWRNKETGKLISFDKAEAMKQGEITQHEDIISGSNHDFKEVARFDSSTDSLMTHLVFRNEGTGEVVCSCPGFTYKGHCFHTDKVKKEYENKGLEG